MSAQSPSPLTSIEGLSFAEAQKISALLMEQTRKNGNLMLSLAQAVYALRDAGEIAATRGDGQTGEVVELSIREILHALRAYQLHPEQVRLSEARTQLNGRDGE